MKRKYDKHYYEEYARLVLFNYFDIPIMGVKDQPDLQCEAGNIGIEVTISIPKKVIL